MLWLSTFYFSHAIRRSQGSSTLLLHFHHHCQLHMTSLIQRPLVLAIDGFWSNLVRLAHLARLASWKRKFLQHLAQVVSDSFLYVPTPSLPLECDGFKKATHDILHKTVASDTPHKIKNRAALLLLDNSDPSGTTIAHYCTAGCHDCPASTIKSEMVKAYLQEFGTFFDVPLLARWKHYGPAIDYMRKGLYLHQILPRTIMQMGCQTLAGQSFDVERFLDVSGQPQDSVLEDTLECSVSLAALNGKRQKKLIDFFSQTNIIQQGAIIDALIKPLDMLLDRRFHRTKYLHRLSHQLNFFPGGFMIYVSTIPKPQDKT